MFGQYSFSGIIAAVIVLILTIFYKDQSILAFIALMPISLFTEEIESFMWISALVYGSVLSLSIYSSFRTYNWNLIVINYILIYFSLWAISLGVLKTGKNIQNTAYLICSVCAILFIYTGIRKDRNYSKLNKKVTQKNS